MLRTKLFNSVKSFLPKISETEMVALRSGTTCIDRDIFLGKVSHDDYTKISRPDSVFSASKVSTLVDKYPEQKPYPSEKSTELFDYLGTQGFFSFLIPKEYGGNKMSVQEMSQILTYITSANPALGVITMVPNSLGPSELLLHYGTENQKNKHLPRLASGECIPCFGLTGPKNGSDATGSIDTGKVIRRSDGSLCVEVSVNKRYITLAPVANLIGLAFRLEDPDNLLPSGKTGVTVALVERGLKGLSLDYYHNPLDCGFPNGTVQGTFQIELDDVIGGEDRIGDGWKMLMECLAAGRGICLPATANAGAKVSTLSMYLYSKHREQFRIPLIKMEAVQNKLATMLINTWAIQSGVYVTNKLLDSGERPAVVSAIMKEQTTERARDVLNDAMDIHAGSAICLGQNNILAKFYRSTPIGITVEGSNTLTKNLIIFGQGLNKSHPYIYPILDSILQNDTDTFYKAFNSIVKHSVSKYFEAIYKSLTPFHVDKLEIQTTQFACLSNFVALKGGAIKSEQSLSADMATILGNLFLAHSVVIYESDNKISPILRDLTIESLLCENEYLFNRVIANLPLGNMLLGFMKVRSDTSYNRNRKVIDELTTNFKICDELAKDIHIDIAIGNLLKLDQLQKGTAEYERLYNDVIQVGMYPIEATTDHCSV